MPGVMTVRRDLLQRVGGFDESLSGYEDDDLFLRLFLNGTVRYLPESTLKWRMHEENYGQSSRMVRSRPRYWEKLMAEHTAGGTDRRRVHGISRRFFREFLRQAAHQLRDGNPVFSENLATGKRIVPHLGLFDRLMFGYWMATWCRLAAGSEPVRNLLEGVVARVRNAAAIAALIARSCRGACAVRWEGLSRRAGVARSLSKAAEPGSACGTHESRRSQPDALDAGARARKRQHRAGGAPCRCTRARGRPEPPTRRGACASIEARCSSRSAGMRRSRARGRPPPPAWTNRLAGQ